MFKNKNFYNLYDRKFYLTPLGEQRKMAIIGCNEYDQCNKHYDIIVSTVDVNLHLQFVVQ